MHSSLLILTLSLLYRILPILHPAFMWGLYEFPGLYFGLYLELLSAYEWRLYMESPLAAAITLFGIHHLLTEEFQTL